MILCASCGIRRATYRVETSCGHMDYCALHRPLEPIYIIDVPA